MNENNDNNVNIPGEENDYIMHSKAYTQCIVPRCEATCQTRQGHTNKICGKQCVWERDHADEHWYHCDTQLYCFSDSEDEELCTDCAVKDIDNNPLDDLNPKSPRGCCCGTPISTDTTYMTCQGLYCNHVMCPECMELSYTGQVNTIFQHCMCCW
jgi:hypothetical protein